MTDQPFTIRAVGENVIAVDCHNDYTRSKPSFLVPKRADGAAASARRRAVVAGDEDASRRSERRARPHLPQDRSRRSDRGAPRLLAGRRDGHGRPRLCRLRARRQQRLAIQEPGRHRRARRRRPQTAGATNTASITDIPARETTSSPGCCRRRALACSSIRSFPMTIDLRDGFSVSRQEHPHLLLHRRPDAGGGGEELRAAHRAAADASGVGARLRAVDARVDGSRRARFRHHLFPREADSGRRLRPSHHLRRRGRHRPRRPSGFHAGYLDYYQGWHPRRGLQGLQPEAPAERRRRHPDAARARLPADRPRLLGRRFLRRGREREALAGLQATFVRRLVGLVAGRHRVLRRRRGELLRRVLRGQRSEEVHRRVPRGARQRLGAASRQGLLRAPAPRFSRPARLHPEPHGLPRACRPMPPASTRGTTGAAGS